MKYKVELKVEVKSVKIESKTVSLNQYIAVKLKEKRNNLLLSQKEVADYLKSSRSHLSNLESGRFTTTLKTIEKLCEIYKCKSSDILPF